MALQAQLTSGDELDPPCRGSGSTSSSPFMASPLPSGAPVDITTGGHHKHRNTTRGSLPVTTPRALGLLLPRHDLNLTGSSSLGRWSAAACRLACSRRVATITSASGLSSQAAAVVNITAPATPLDGSTSTATTSSREDPAGEEGRRRGGAAGIIS